MLYDFVFNYAIETYSIQNEGRPVVAERFIRVLKFINTQLSYQKMCILIN